MGTTVRIVVKDLNAEMKRRMRRRKTPYRYKTDPDGRRYRVYIVDLASPHFGVDFTRAFQSSVRRIRRDNKRILGYADIALPKK